MIFFIEGQIKVGFPFSLLSVSSLGLFLSMFIIV